MSCPNVIVDQRCGEAAEINEPAKTKPEKREKKDLSEREDTGWYVC
jgi:hypothetical protein